MPDEELLRKLGLGSNMHPNRPSIDLHMSQVASRLFSELVVEARAHGKRPTDLMTMIGQMLFQTPTAVSVNPEQRRTLRTALLGIMAKLLEIDIRTERTRYAYEDKTGNVATVDMHGVGDDDDPNP